MRLAIAAAAACLCLIVAGCGGGDSTTGSTTAGGGTTTQKKPASRATIDGKVFEQRIVSQAGTHGSDPVARVSCPAQVRARAGASFDCRVVTKKGRRETAVVTLQDPAGKGYTIAINSNG